MDSMLASLMAPPALDQLTRVLAVQPHPDDNEIALGGTIAAWTRAGVEVTYCTVTTGDLGSETLPPPELAVIRARELEAAGRRLGVTGFLSLGFPDGMDNAREPAVALALAQVIRRVKPDLVVCPDPFLPYESHRDHLIAGRAATEAFRCAGSRHFPRGYEGETFSPRAIGYYYTARPNTFFDVTETLEDRFQAMALHASQMDAATLTLYRAYFTDLARRLAQGRGYAYAEGLKVLAPIHLHCFTEAADI